MELQRHPIRGALYGLLIGLMLAYFVFFRFTMFPFESLGGTITKFVIVVLIGVAIGVAFAYLAPPKGPKQPTADTAPEAATEAE